MPDAEKGAALGIAFVLGAAMLLSFKGIFIKLAYAEGVGVVALLWLRFAIALPFFWAFALWRLGPEGIFRIERRDFLAALIGGGVTSWGAWIADFTALSMIDVSLSRIILFSFPAFVLLFDSLRRGRAPPLRQWAALILIEAGVVLSLGGFDVAYMVANLEGAAWAMLSGLVFAVYIMINRETTTRTGSIRFTLFAVTGACAVLTVHFFVARPVAELAVSPMGLLWAGMIALFATLLPYFMFSEGIRRAGASRASLVSALGSPATIALAFVILGESMGPIQLIGGAVVILGVVALEARRRKPAISPDTE